MIVAPTKIPPAKAVVIGKMRRRSFTFCSVPASSRTLAPSLAGASIPLFKRRFEVSLIDVLQSPPRGGRKQWTDLPRKWIIVGARGKRAHMRHRHAQQSPDRPLQEACLGERQGLNQQPA